MKEKPKKCLILSSFVLTTLILAILIMIGLTVGILSILRSGTESLIELTTLTSQQTESNISTSTTTKDYRLIGILTLNIFYCLSN